MPYNDYGEYYSSDDGYSSDDHTSYEESDGPDPYCEPCDRYFVNMDALESHLIRSSHHNYCQSCNRDFCNAVALNQHLNSPVHSVKRFTCQFCGFITKTRAGVAQHVECGSCRKSPVDRKDIPKVIRSFEIAAGAPNLLTKPRNNIQYSSTTSTSQKQPTNFIVIDPDNAWNGDMYECHLCSRAFHTVSSLSQHLSSAAHDPTARVIDAGKAWNGYKYACCLCDRELNSIRALEQHLTSPAHDRSEFQCRQCRLDFKLISALIQHLDNGNCGGGGSKMNKVFGYIAAPEYSRRT